MPPQQFARLRIDTDDLLREQNGHLRLSIDLNQQRRGMRAAKVVLFPDNRPVALPDLHHGAAVAAGEHDERVFVRKRM